MQLQFVIGCAHYKSNENYVFDVPLVKYVNAFRKLIVWRNTVYIIAN